MAKFPRTNVRILPSSIVKNVASVEPNKILNLIDISLSESLNSSRILP